MCNCVEVGRVTFAPPPPVGWPVTAELLVMEGMLSERTIARRKRKVLDKFEPHATAAIKRAFRSEAARVLDIVRAFRLPYVPRETAMSATVTEGWVTINGAHVLLGDDDGGGGGKSGGTTENKQPQDMTYEEWVAAGKPNDPKGDNIPRQERYETMRRIAFERSKEFREKFAGSKAVDNNGDPLLLHHGSSRADLPDGTVFYTTNPTVAGWFSTLADPTGERFVRQDYLVIHNPLEVKAPTGLEAGSQEGARFINDAITKAKSAGNDGVVIRDIYESGFRGHDYIVFSQGQVIPYKTRRLNHLGRSRTRKESGIVAEAAVPRYATNPDLARLLDFILNGQSASPYEAAFDTLYREVMPGAMDAATAEAMAAAGVGITGPLGRFPGAEKWIRDNAIRFGKKFAPGVTEATNAAIRNQLALGWKDFEPMDKLMARVRKVYSTATDYRAEMIARTEGNRAYTSASHEAYDQLGADGHFSIISGSEYAVWPEICAVNASLGVIPMSQQFEDIDGNPVDGPPYHPNCLCDEGIDFSDSWQLPEWVMAEGI